MQKSKKVLVIVLAVAAGIVLAKDTVATVVVSGGIKAMTGLDARIARMQVGLLTSAVGITGLQILNPRGFSERVMVDMPDLYVKYRLGAFLRGKAHLDRLRLHLSQLRATKNREGTLNLAAINTLETGHAKDAKKPQPTLELQIDVLELKIGRVVFTDETTSPPTVKEFAVNVDERYEHITNPALFAGLVVSRALVKTTVGQLAHFDVAGLQSSVAEGLKRSAGTLTSVLTERTQQAEVLGKRAVGTATDAVTEAAGAVKKLLDR